MKSSHSPLRVVVQCSCKISIIPLITIGESHANRKSFFLSNTVCLRRYSHQMTVQVPPYMMKCVHLSINWMPSRGVSGKKGRKESIQISMIQVTDRGYFLINCLSFCIIALNFGAKVRIILYFCKRKERYYGRES